MLSYVVGFVAALIFVINPLSQILWAPRPGHEPAARPQLNSSLLAIDEANATAPECRADGYTARVLHREPLVVYLEGFLSDDERGHLLAISEALFEPSTVTHDGHSTQRDTSVRDSHVALVPRTDAVRCIEARARAFQGWRQDVWIERLRTQRYTPGGHYSHHFDWGSSARGWGRLSSFMVWVDAAEGLVGGGTEFPLLPRPAAPEWCRFVQCPPQHDAGALADETGVVFNVVPGNAVYWENLAPDGSGYQDTWHAGLPVEKGVKVGLNIWSFGHV